MSYRRWMTVRVALAVAVIACSSPSSAPPQPPIEKPPVVTTPLPDASPYATAEMPPDAAIARGRFAVAWRKAGAGEGGFANSVAVRSDGSVVLGGDAHLANWTKKKRPKLRPSFVALLDAKGALVWARDFGLGTITSVAAVSDGVIACGGLQKAKNASGLVVLSLASDGKEKWRFTAGGTGAASCSDLAVLPDGKIVIVGELTGETKFGEPTSRSLGDRDAFVAVLDASGKPRWVATAGSAQSDSAHAVAVSGGAIYVTGWYEGPAKFGDHTLAFPASKGATANPSNMFVARYTLAGDTVWVQRVGSVDSFDRGWAIDAVSDGVVVAGDLEGNGFVARYGADGKQRWLREAAGTARAVLALPADDILLATYERASGDTSETVVARYAGDSDLIDRARLGGGAPETEHDVFDLARNDRGRIAIAGRLVGESTITGELVKPVAQKVSNKDGQGIVVDVLDP